MSEAPNILYALIRFVAYAPFSVVPVLTWSVFMAVALSLYFYYKPMPLDYLFTPITIAFIMYYGFKRDGWAGVAGAALGVALIPLLNFEGILADAAILFWLVVLYLLKALWQFMMAWATPIFIAGILAGLLPFVSILFGVIAGLVVGFSISGVSMYISHITSSIKRMIHRLTGRLPPGAQALTALPTAALVMALEFSFAMMILFFAILFATGFIIGSMLGKIIVQIMVVGDTASFVIGLLFSKFWHNIQMETFSPAAFMATVVAYLANAGTPAMLMAISTALLLTPRYGRVAYTWMAVALAAHAFLSMVGLI